MLYTVVRTLQILLDIPFATDPNNGKIVDMFFFVRIHFGRLITSSDNYATNRKVACSILYEVFFFFNFHNPFGRTRP
jgi:hypothetical protein